jgi:ABC-type antimicrobial peptide transport system permease subunit
MIVDLKAFQIQHLFWWTRQVVLVLLGCFFLIFGIHILVSSYKLEEPFSFILTFFASNFIILISLTLVIVFVYQMKAFVVVSRAIERQDILDGKKSEEDR